MENLLGEIQVCLDDSAREMYSMIDIISNLKCELGEGLIWDPALNLLLMTDITRNRLIAIDVYHDTYCQWDMPELIGWVLLTERRSTYALGLKSGIAFFDTTSQSALSWVNREFPYDPKCRLNDACTDALGRIWYGSMNYCDNTKKDGKLASISGKLHPKVHDSGFTVTNGPLISPDSEYLLLNDTLKGIVYQYDFSLTSGELSTRRIFMTFQPDQGFPDGMCFDIAGNLWLAMWGTGKVLKVSRQGEILHEYNIPAPNVTNVCFGGVNLDRLFISSATIVLEESNANMFLQSGSVFELKNHGARGYNSHLVKLES